jgi:hypothetical protein
MLQYNTEPLGHHDVTFRWSTVVEQQRTMVLRLMRSLEVIVLDVLRPAKPSCSRPGCDDLVEAALDTLHERSRHATFHARGRTPHSQSLASANANDS